MKTFGLNCKLHAWHNKLKWHEFCPSSQAKAHLPIEVSAVEAVYEDQPEQQHTEMTESTELDAPLQQRQKQEHVQRIIAGVKQNFGKINVAPEFSEEDLVPVEIPDLPDSCGSDVDDEEANEEEEEDMGDSGNGEEESGEAEEGKELPVAGCSYRAAAKTTREMNKELDGKIAKLKHFLDSAKSKRFSTIRSVYPFIFLSSCLFSCVLPFLLTRLCEAMQAGLCKVNTRTLSTSRLLFCSLWQEPWTCLMIYDALYNVFVTLHCFVFLGFWI